MIVIVIVIVTQAALDGGTVQATVTVKTMGKVTVKMNKLIVNIETFFNSYDNKHYSYGNGHKIGKGYGYGFGHGYGYITGDSNGFGFGHGNGNLKGNGNGNGNGYGNG